MYVCTAVDINFKVNAFHFNKSKTAGECPTVELGGASKLVASVATAFASAYLMA